METFYIKGSCRNEWISNIWDIYPISVTVLQVPKFDSTLITILKLFLYTMPSVDFEKKI